MHTHKYTYIHIHTNILANIRITQSAQRGLPATLEGTYATPVAMMQSNSGYTYDSATLQVGYQHGSHAYAANQNGGFTPNDLGVTGTPTNPITAVPIDSQMRRTVPSIWADDD